MALPFRLRPLGSKHRLHIAELAVLSTRCVSKESAGCFHIDKKIRERLANVVFGDAGWERTRKRPGASVASEPAGAKPPRGGAGVGVVIEQKTIHRLRFNFSNFLFRAIKIWRNSLLAGLNVT